MPILTIQQAFDLASRHLDAGELEEAERLYRLILQQQPGHGDAIHNLGVIAQRVGRSDVAVELFRQAVAIQADDAVAHYNLGTALRDRGQLDDAIAAYLRALAINPNLSPAYANLGIALAESGQFARSVVAFREAVARAPNDARAWDNLGIALIRNGQPGDAIDAYQRALAIGHDLADIKPRLAVAYNEFGMLLEERGRSLDAIDAYRNAIARQPDLPQPHNNLANSLTATGRFDEAIAQARQAIALRPDYADAYSNLGVAKAATGALDEAMAAYRRAIALNGEMPEPHSNLALALLLRGEFAEGWREYDWRWRAYRLISPGSKFPQPMWDGSELAGRTILLHAEQGIGDTIQFIRYVPMVVKRGGRVVVEAQSSLLRLLRQISDVAEWIAEGAVRPAFDMHCPLLHLPAIFATDLQSILAQPQPLRADAKLAASWRKRLAEMSSGFKVGLVRAGSVHHKNDRNRSLDPALLAPLAAIPAVQFYSLQKNEVATRPPPPTELRLVDWTNELNDFAETAGLIDGLDLVIAADTAVAHLAAAMGKPVWLLLPFVPDWRWMQQRDDSPWYPTMRLFRQSAPGDWAGVIARVVEALRGAASACGAATTMI